VGAKINFAGLGLVGYYYDGKNIGGSSMIAPGTSASGLNYDTSAEDRDVRGGYVQATYKLPVGTTLGASYGISKIKGTAGDRALNTAALTGDFENESYILGAYHPITKHLNLVGEYVNTEYQNISNFKGYDGKAKTFSLGAILFF
jgi:predicted porin